MKIKFTKLPTTGGTIKVSLDGGQSFTDYNIEDIQDSGIPLDDNQDYEKIMIKGPASLLKDLNVIKQIKLEGSDGSSSGAGLSIKKTYWGWADDATGPATCYTTSNPVEGSKVYHYVNGEMIESSQTYLGIGGGGATGLMLNNPFSKSNRQHYSNLDVEIEEPVTAPEEKPFLYILYDTGYVNYQNRGGAFASIIFNRAGINRAFGYEVDLIDFGVLLNKNPVWKPIPNRISNDITVCYTTIMGTFDTINSNIDEFHVELFDGKNTVTYPLVLGNVFDN